MYCRKAALGSLGRRPWGKHPQVKVSTGLMSMKAKMRRVLPLGLCPGNKEGLSKRQEDVSRGCKFPFGSIGVLDRRNSVFGCMCPLQKPTVSISVCVTYLFLFVDSALSAL